MCTRALSLGLAAVLAVACTDQTPTSTLDTVPGPQLNTVPGHGPVVQQVSGGWNNVDPPPTNFPRSFSFVAQRFADGTVTGNWERFGVCSGEVVCFTVVGTQAWIGTIARNKPDGSLCSDFNDTEGGFRVVDNGQGANAPPDQASLQFVNLGPGGAAAYCAATPAGPPLLTLEKGNITIR